MYLVWFILCIASNCELSLIGGHSVQTVSRSIRLHDNDHPLVPARFLHLRMSVLEVRQLEAYQLDFVAELFGGTGDLVIFAIQKCREFVWLNTTKTIYK